MRILLGSGGIATEERRATYRELVKNHFESSSEVLFVPLASNDHSAYTDRMQNFLGSEAPTLVGLESFEDEIDAVNRAEAIYIGGGNSFLLIKELHDRGLIEPIRNAVLGGASYLGVSAGANVSCRTMMTTNDMPIVSPPSFNSLGLVPFQINPHFYPGKLIFMDGDDYANHYGESRGQRIAEFHQHHEDPVIGMWEGSFVQWDGSRGRLTGRATSFLYGAEPHDLHDGAEFDAKLRIIN